MSNVQFVERAKFYQAISTRDSKRCRFEDSSGHRCENTKSLRLIKISRKNLRLGIGAYCLLCPEHRETHAASQEKSFRTRWEVVKATYYS